MEGNQLPWARSSPTYLVLDEKYYLGNHEMLQGSTSRDGIRLSCYRCSNSKPSRNYIKLTSCICFLFQSLLFTACLHEWLLLGVR